MFINSCLSEKLEKVADFLLSSMEKEQKELQVASLERRYVFLIGEMELLEAEVDKVVEKMKALGVEVAEEPK